MRKALQDIVANLAAQGITVYPSGTPLENVPDTETRITYSWEFSDLGTDNMNIRGILQITFSVRSYAADREDAVWGAADNLVDTLKTIYPRRLRNCYVRSGEGDENSMTIEVGASFIVMEKGGLT